MDVLWTRALWVLQTTLNLTNYAVQNKSNCKEKL